MQHPARAWAPSWRRSWHATTAAVAVVALVLQLVLVATGSAVLAEDDPPGLGLRLARFCAYFTIQSNLLVAIAAVTLARDPDRDDRGHRPAWRVLRAAGLVGIVVTGLVHVTLLRPLLDLDGWDRAADTLLHQAVPVLAVLGWLAFGPRPRVDVRVLGLALLWPVAWVIETLLVGVATGWFPYPFLDPDEGGWGAVLVACVGVTVLVVAVAAVVLVVDRRGHVTDRCEY